MPQLPAEDQNQDVPSYSDKGVVGNDGYEWLEYPASSGKHFYRVPGSGAWRSGSPTVLFHRCNLEILNHATNLDTTAD